MPPRFTYWTILLDGQPTAFRAAEREELLPTLKQLQAKNPSAEMKWFARGRVWESPEQARHARQEEEAKAREAAAKDRRGHEWRPGGEHKDPREKFKKETFQARRRREKKAANLARQPFPPSSKEFGGHRAGDERPTRRPFSPRQENGAPRDQQTRPRFGSNRGPQPSGQGFRPGEGSGRPGGGFKPRGDRPGGNRPGGFKPRGEWPGSDRPGGGFKPRGDRPGGFNPRGDRPGGDRPGGFKPRGDRPGGFNPRGNRPGGDRTGGFKPGGDRRWGGRPEGAKANRPGEHRRPWQQKPRPEGDRPRTPAPDERERPPREDRPPTHDPRPAPQPAPPPKPSAPDIPEPERIRIIPEPPERATPPPDTGGRVPPHKTKMPRLKKR